MSAGRLTAAIALLIGCASADPAPDVGVPARQVTSVFADECGNELYSDDEGARRLYASVAPHIWPGSIPPWDELGADERKPWEAGIEELLSFAVCPGAK